MLRIIALCVAVVLLSGCKLALMIVEGGNVTSSTGAHNCTAGSYCVFEINDTDFNVTFTAEPEPGYAFVRWSNGDDFQCPGSTNPVCVLNNTLLAGNAFADAIIASKKIYYLHPVFEFSPTEIGPQYSLP